MKPHATSARTAGMLDNYKRELAKLLTEVHGRDERALEAVGALVAHGQLKALSKAHKKGVVGPRLADLFEHCQKDPWKLAILLEREKPYDEVPPEQLGLL